MQTVARRADVLHLPGSAGGSEQGDASGSKLALQLDDQHDVKQVTVDTEQDGWGASIYVSDRAASSLTTLSDWGPVRAQGSDLGRVHTFDTGGVKGQSVLVWLTQLPKGDNGQHFVSVSEVRLA